MKFTVSFKCPDAVDYALDGIFKYSDNPIKDELQESCEDVVRKFVMFGEMVTIEFDTDAQTARVVQVR
jgi:hypothetical protein